VETEEDGSKRERTCGRGPMYVTLQGAGYVSDGCGSPDFHGLRVDTNRPYFEHRSHSVFCRDSTMWHSPQAHRRARPPRRCKRQFLDGTARWMPLLYVRDRRCAAQDSRGSSSCPEGLVTSALPWSMSARAGAAEFS
jgi:hypothetical protein